MSRKTLNQNGNQKGIHTAQTNGSQKPAEPLRGTSSNVRKEDSEISAKVLQVMEVTGATEEVALLALHDCEYDVEKTIDFIFESDVEKTMEISVVGQINNKVERVEPVEQQQWLVSTAKRNGKKSYNQSDQIPETTEKEFTNSRENHRRSKQTRASRSAQNDENVPSKDNFTKDDTHRWQNRPAWKSGRVYTNKKKAFDDELLTSFENVSVNQLEKDPAPKSSSDGLSDSDEWAGESLVVTNKTVAPDSLPSLIDEVNDQTWGNEEWQNDEEDSTSFQTPTEQMLESSKNLPETQIPVIFISRDCSQTRLVPCSAPIPSTPIEFAPGTNFSSDISSCTEKYHFGNTEVIENIFLSQKREEPVVNTMADIVEHTGIDNVTIQSEQSASISNKEIELSPDEPSSQSNVDLKSNEQSLYNEFTNQSITTDGKPSQSMTPDKSLISEYNTGNEPGSYSHQDLTKTKSLPTHSEILNQNSNTRGQISSSFKNEVSATSENQLNSTTHPNLASHASYYPTAAAPLINPNFPLPNNSTHYSPNSYDLEQQNAPLMSQMNHQTFMFDLDNQQSQLGHDAGSGNANNRKMDIPTTAAPGLYPANPAIYPAINYLAALAAANPHFYSQFLNMNPLLTPVTNNSHQANAPIVTSVNQGYTNMKPMNNYQGFNQTYNHSQTYEDSDLSSKFNSNKSVYGQSKNGNYNSSNENKPQSNASMNSGGHHPAVSAYPPQTHHAPYPGGIYGNNWAPPTLHTIIPPPPSLAAMNSAHPSQPMGMHLVGHPQ